MITDEERILILGIHALALARAADELAKFSKFSADDWLSVLLREAKATVDKASVTEQQAIFDRLLRAAEIPPDELD